jgi:hypothetical protein
MHELAAFLAALPGRVAHRPVLAREPVSVAAVRTWCDLMGERPPTGIGAHVVAPPAALPMWASRGWRPAVR